MRPILSGLTFREAERYALMLEAEGVVHEFRKVGKRWVLLAEEGQEARVRELVFQFRGEEAAVSDEAGPEGVESSRTEPLPPHRRTWTGIWAALLLFAIHAWIDGHGDYQAIIENAGAAADRILAGEWWRTVTALTLHADGGHLAANMAALAVFGTVACHSAGYGMAWLLILLSGAAGNMSNALLYGHGHMSIGASTAVFGAVGLLGGHRFVESVRLGARRMRALAPLVAALGLLAMMGEGHDQRTDVTAHLFGWVWGAISGVGLGLARCRPGRPALCGSGAYDRMQPLLLVATLVILAMCWRLALP